MIILEHRLYFIAGDILSNSISGTAAALLAAGIVDSSWQMLPAMLIGMTAGMGLSMLLMPVFVGLFGAMEVMLPVMLSAMLAGMVFAMVVTMQQLPLAEILLGGACTGVLVLMLTYSANALLRGKRL